MPSTPILFVLALSLSTPTMSTPGVPPPMKPGVQDVPAIPGEREGPTVTAQFPATAAIAEVKADLPGPAVAGAAPPVTARHAPVVPAGVWPLMPSPTVIRRFDPPPQPWLPGHRGADLTGQPGAEVRSAAAGTVAFQGSVAGRGVISIAHPGGFRTTYEPVTAADLQPGMPIARGQPLGTLDPGHPGCPTAACLHWGLRQGDRYLDPLLLIGRGQVRLLPLIRGPRQ